MHLFPTIKPEPIRKTFFIPVKNYRDPANNHTVTWGCQCPECGAYHEFTFGDKWNFCPACGCAATEKKYECRIQ